MRTHVTGLLLLCAMALPLGSAHAFCGFYVASGEAKLFNHASQVVLVRDGDRTVMTMVNDFKGEPKEFAVVVPVPVVLEKGQVHVGDKAIVDHLDAYSAPRLVEYHDPSPCPQPVPVARYMDSAPGVMMAQELLSVRGGRAEEVRIEAKFTVDEYDILILSADQSDALERWLRQHHYRIPEGASRVLGTYLKQGMKFFVAKVNLKEQQRLGFQYLRPIQIAYESPKFMLPIRLGMVNAEGPQELFIYALTRKGRVEPTNYRSVKLPSDQDIPEYVQQRFPDFYRAMFSQQVRKEDMNVVFTEYAWDMAGCDPCASSPLSPEEQRALGVFWIGDPSAPNAMPAGTFVTRLHARYDAAHFPEDLVLQETADRQNWQARFILRHPWKGDHDCPQAAAYYDQVRERRAREAVNLVALTGWPAVDVNKQMAADAKWLPPRDTKPSRWWDAMWKK